MLLNLAKAAFMQVPVQRHRRAGAPSKLAPHTLAHTRACLAPSRDLTLKDVAASIVTTVEAALEAEECTLWLVDKVSLMARPHNARHASSPSRCVIHSTAACSTKRGCGLTRVQI